jgi:16S rRNA (guanine(966)-N(2))-methyltransferase RsmD
MRIISGTAGGRRLRTPKDRRIRPTSDRVKEALFNILAVLLGSFSGVRVLDVFAGTGNLGIEALSRGAAEALFIDDSRESALLVQENLDLTGLAGRGRVLQKEALVALKLLEKKGERFGLVFLDPPYREGLSTAVLAFLAGSGLIAAGSVVVAETDAREELAEAFGPLRRFDERRYGDTALAFFQCEPQTSPVEHESQTTGSCAH